MRTSDQLTVAVIQPNLVWENPPVNRDQLAQQIDKIPSKVDLIIFPEMFTTGFTMNALEMAEDMSGSTISWMKSQSAQKNCVLTGSLIVKEAGKFFNRLVWVSSDGSIDYYDKNYLFSLAKEDRTFSAGDRRKTMVLNGWKICPLICYDLRFPELARNQEYYDILIYVANFPASRDYAWRQLLIARSIENQCYTLGINRVGSDAVGIDYQGRSMLVDFDGQVLQELNDQEDFFIHTLMRHPLEVYRRTYPFLDDQK